MRRAVRRLRRTLAARLFGTVVAARTAEKIAALTFDDGPDPEFTPKLLDIFARYSATGTFFMIGSAAEAHPELVARVAREGHEIGNHSWNHASLPLLSRGELDDQITRTRDAIAPHGGRLLRPPYGHQTLRTFREAQAQGYEVVCWTLMPEDWLGYDAATLAGRVLDGLSPGAVILLHDGLFSWLDPRYRDRTPTLEAVETILKARPDYHFVTVSELLRLGKAVRTYWIREPKADFLGALSSLNPCVVTGAASSTGRPRRRAG